MALLSFRPLSPLVRAYLVPGRNPSEFACGVINVGGEIRRPATRLLEETFRFLCLRLPGRSITEPERPGSPARVHQRTNTAPSALSHGYVPRSAPLCPTCASFPSVELFNVDGGLRGAFSPSPQTCTSTQVLMYRPLIIHAAPVCVAASDL